MSMYGITDAKTGAALTESARRLDHLHDRAEEIGVDDPDMRVLDLELAQGVLEHRVLMLPELVDLLEAPCSRVVVCRAGTAGE
jgi:hypothetical protein